MDNYVLRIASINLNNVLLILNELNNINKNEIYIKDEGNLNDHKWIRQIFLELSEELENAKIEIRYNALSKLLFLFIKDPEKNFMLNDKLEENYDTQLISSGFHNGILNVLIKNLIFFYFRFSEFNM
jgi:hypothetical protein